MLGVPLSTVIDVVELWIDVGKHTLRLTNRYYMDDFLVIEDEDGGIFFSCIDWLPHIEL